MTDTWLQKMAKVKPMPLSPDAYSSDTQPHRLQRHQETTPMPWGMGRIRQPQNADQIKDLYSGVHASEDFDLAAVYANNKATAGDPPVVIEFATQQRWRNDVDASHVMIDDINDRVMEIDGLAEAMQQYEETGEIDEEFISDTFEDIENQQYDDMFGDNDYGQDYDLTDELSSRARRIHPSQLAEYYNKYYSENPARAFFRNYLVPLFKREGIEANIFGFMVNQMRFMEPIEDEQIVAVYRVDRFNPEIFDPMKHDFENDEQPELDEEGRQWVGMDEAYYFSPQSGAQLIYESPIAEDLRTNGNIFFHGTTLARAKKALTTLEMGDTVTASSKIAGVYEEEADDYFDERIRQDLDVPEDRSKVHHRNDEGFVEDASGHAFWGSRASGILFVRKNPKYGFQVMLTLRSMDVEEPGTWGVPGGAIPKGDDPLRSALRETAEEIGGLPRGNLKPLGHIIWKAPGGTFTFTTFIIEVRQEWTPDSFNWEADAADWFTLEDAETLDLHPGVRDVFNQIQGLASRDYKGYSR